MRDTVANKISFYHVTLLLLSLPYDRFYSHIIFISFAVHTLIHLKKERLKHAVTWTNLLLQSVFFLTLLGIIYSSNRPEGFNELDRQAFILLIPLLFSLSTLDFRKYRYPLLRVFTWGCAATVGYLYLHAMATIGYYDLSFTRLFSHAFINHNFSNPIGIHATQLAMQVAIALVFSLCALLSAKTWPLKLLHSCCCVLLLAGIIQLASKSVFAALLLIVNFGIPYLVLAGRQRKTYLGIFLVISVLVVAGIFNVENYRIRYLTELKKDLRRVDEDRLTDPRFARWGLALEVAVESPIIGHGSGTEVELLKSRYFENRFYRSYLADFDAHNQYLSFFIKFGVCGLAVYLFTLAFGFRMALAKKDVLLCAFVTVFAVASLSDNLLSVNKGILFYSIFFSLLVFGHYESRGKATKRPPAPL